MLILVALKRKVLVISGRRYHKAVTLLHQGAYRGYIKFVESVKVEAEMYNRFKDYYSYVFYITKKKQY
jgi:hypothetical protein